MRIPLPDSQDPAFFLTPHHDLFQICLLLLHRLLLIIRAILFHAATFRHLPRTWHNDFIIVLRMLFSDNMRKHSLFELDSSIWLSQLFDYFLFFDGLDFLVEGDLFFHILFGNGILVFKTFGDIVTRRFRWFFVVVGLVDDIDLHKPILFVFNRLREELRLNFLSHRCTHLQWPLWNTLQIVNASSLCLPSFKTIFTVTVNRPAHRGWLFWGARVQ